MVALADRYAQRTDLARSLGRIDKQAGQGCSDNHDGNPAQPRSLRFRLHPAQRDALVKDYLNGTPTTQLTRRYQLGKGTVLRILSEAGVTMRNQPLSQSQVDEAVELYRQGWSLARIATRLGTGPTSVNRALVARGVQLRGRHDRG